MTLFDPRIRPTRFAPVMLMTAAAAMSAAFVTGRVPATPTADDPPTLTSAQVAVLETRAFAAAAAPMGLTAPTAVPVELRRGETFEQAVQRTGVGAAEARTLAATVGRAFRLSDLRPGERFEAAISAHRVPRGDAHVIGLTLRTGPTTQLTVTRDFAGALRLRALEETLVRETRVATGEIEASLPTSLSVAGVDKPIVRAMSALTQASFGADRDPETGDDFVVAFDRTVTEAGRTIETGDLLYASVKGRVVYGFKPASARAIEYFDAAGRPLGTGGFESPLVRARTTSPFGPRRHPISGQAKMHQGTDFAAGMGTPVKAPADGVVVEARTWGGYGNWVRIRHADGLESGYAHLSRFASGLRAGQRVRQGQVVAYVGSTGASTGPHLHYEIWNRGRRVDPSEARVVPPPGLKEIDLSAFRAEKARIDRIVAAGGSRSLLQDARRGRI
ncbi:M23 family metallopeptidase [Brevundimonas variabilis]|uniref:Murein DD-endopeptidase MepM/ murein hydrolase activator NlpD n=1 Tax=Brevundimonas variabilis TaxID=74312 RepID=A0A7W9CHD0_9CAUL|nr:M23 family metallopeptidase [Brevundimonas variabilis]MBB5745665.1 murein DD-endopeptidase MepM/ murein hydrolase activator NlpD [Brevundimonas variabilis]